jgi:hypothetical protein
MNSEGFIFLDFFKWKIYDLIVGTKNDNPELFGFFMFVGLPGEGKTLSLVRKFNNLRQKYGDSVYIFTNFGWSGQDAPFETWRMLLLAYDKPAIFGFDEIQNEFQSRDFGAFPKELITAVTQFRKGNGIAVYGTTQVFTNVDIIIRSQCKEVIACRTKFSRLTINRHYEPTQFELWQSSKGTDNQMRVVMSKYSIFIQTDWIRNQYNTHQFLESAVARMQLEALPDELAEKLQKFTINGNSSQ